MKKAQRPTSIEGIQPHQLHPPMLELNQNLATSEDSLEEENGNNNNHSDEDEDEKRDNSKESDDAGLSDEGLGDLNSEASNSPQPPSLLGGLKSSSTAFVKDLHCDITSEDSCCDGKEAGVEAVLVLEAASRNNNSSLPTSPCDERVPSRIAFPKMRLQKSQTNL